MKQLANTGLAIALTFTLIAIPVAGSATDPVQIHAVLAATGAFAFNGEES